MFIFRLLFAMIGMALALVLLPLRLIGLPFTIITGFITHFVRFMMRHVWLVILVVLVIIFMVSGKKSDHQLRELTPAKSGAPPGAVEAVTKHEDGDSAFATDLYALMTDDERGQYSRNYYWAMSNLPNGQVHSWSSVNIAGSLRANDSFTNSSGYRCRHFTEVLKVHHIQQKLTGIACEQGTGSWCKLKPNATPACGLGGSGGGLLDGITNSLQNLF